MQGVDGEVSGSFRDPSGFLFYRDGVLYRQINASYAEHYDMLMGSGLYDELVADGLLIPHEEVDVEPHSPDVAYKVIKPEPIPFVSYPYEWCFSQLKDAALLTLELQRRAIERKMILKDASAYNIQFVGPRPVFIDTLSFEIHREGEPWVAYRQFCQHFLAPLALMSYVDVRLGQLSRVHIDGIPLDLASKLLPKRTRIGFGLSVHIHLHARSQKHFADKPVKPEAKKVGRLSLLGLIDSLKGTVSKLRWQPRDTQWSDYYEDTNYTEAALEHKKRIVGEFLEEAKPTDVWDLGANVGVFSRIAASKGARVVALDADPAAVERNYLDCKRDGADILPLLVDLTNPSPAVGWSCAERDSLLQRAPAHTIMALALVHHLAISNNLPLSRIAEFFARICSGYLIVEFVPKNDSQVQRLLRTREDIFADYNQQAFEREFGGRFELIRREKIVESERLLYLMKVRRAP
ncbi:MAG TPA: SAM-dependent methyltransferase [Proteobacteria bacterium]|nr:SAM-dependent methyltransferase [Pseudomonadota bacterium]